MKVGEIKIGYVWNDNTIPRDGYGKYIHQEITRIETTKSGRIKLFALLKYRHIDGEITIVENARLFNGALSPNSDF